MDFGMERPIQGNEATEATDGSKKEIGEITPERKDNMPWVQDVAEAEASELISRLNEEIETGENESPEGSEYKTGPSRSGSENEVGIYFFDPTASKKENPEE